MNFTSEVNIRNSKNSCPIEVSPKNLFKPKLDVIKKHLSCGPRKNNNLLNILSFDRLNTQHKNNDIFRTKPKDIKLESRAIKDIMLLKNSLSLHKINLQKKSYTNNKLFSFKGPKFMINGSKFWKTLNQQENRIIDVSSKL